MPDPVPSPPSGKHPWEERLADAGARVEEELQRVVRYLDEEVVPEVRRNSSQALRVAAEQLRQLAERMETRKPSPAPPPPPPPGPSQT